MTAIFNGFFAKLKAKSIIIGVSADDQDLSSSEFNDGKAFYVTGAARTGATVTVPPIDRATFWGADPDNAYAVTIACGTGTITLAPGQWLAVATDGSVNGIDGSALTGSVSSDAVHVITGDHTAAAGEVMDFQLTAPATLTLPATPPDFTTETITNYDGSFGTHTLTIAGNGAQIGTEEGGFTDQITVSRAFLTIALVAFGGQWRILV